MGITAKQLRATLGERSGDTLPPDVSTHPGRVWRVRDKVKTRRWRRSSPG